MRAPTIEVEICFLLAFYPFLPYLLPLRASLGLVVNSLCDWSCTGFSVSDARDICTLPSFLC